MNYVPIFSTIVDSSLWKEPAHVCKMFITMLALKDREQRVPHTSWTLAQKANLTAEEAAEALRILSEPDTRKRPLVEGEKPQPHEGRRIELLPDGQGWKILNGSYYQEVMRQINHRARSAECMRNLRSRAVPKLPKE